MKRALDIAHLFDVPRGEMACEPYGTGNINDTFCLTVRPWTGAVRRYILQRVNRYVFPDPEPMMGNIQRVTHYLRGVIARGGGDPARETLTLVRAMDGRPWITDASGDLWRVYLFIEGTVSTDMPDSPETFAAAGEAFGGDCGCELAIPKPAPRNEAFIVPCDVSYSAKGAPTLDVVEHSGLWSVIANALSFDYLWNEVRVKGGAYGVGFRRGEEGFARFYSYRDPGVDGTLARFDAAADWLAAFEPDEAEMEGYIVATVAAHDAPAKPRAIARREDGAFLCGRAADWREKLRDEKLAATPAAIRACAPVLHKVADLGNVCVFGNEDIIRAAKQPLEVTKLF